MNNPAVASRNFGIILYAITPAASNLIVDKSSIAANNDQTLNYIVSSASTDPLINISNLHMGCKNKRCRSLMYFSVTFTNRIVAVDE